MAETFPIRVAMTALLLGASALMGGDGFGQTVKVTPELEFLSPVGPQDVPGTSSVIINGAVANAPSKVDDHVVSGANLVDERPVPPQLAQSVPPAAEMDQDQAVILLQKLQEENQRLTNENEELKHQVQQLKSLLSQVPAGGNGAALSGAASPVAPVAGGVVSPPLTQPAAPVHTVGRTSSEPLDLSAIASGEVPAPPTPVATPQPTAVGGSLASGIVPTAPTAPAQAPLDPQAAYDKAFGLLQQGDYLKAQKEFAMFLSAYPSAPQAPNAGYFLGETLYKQSLYKDAGDRFLKAYQAAPKGEMAPQSLLMLGQSLAKLNQQEAACSVYAKLSADFPKLSTPVANRLKDDKKNASCT